MKRFGIGLLGGGVLMLGVVLLVLPGPGSLVIPAGLAILAREFTWARGVVVRGNRACGRVGLPRRFRSKLRKLTLPRRPAPTPAPVLRGPLPRWLP
ncbi:MAG: putative transrane protein [Verrucomicrobiota bacterium]|jgi:hypothetical protein